MHNQHFFTRYIPRNQLHQIYLCVLLRSFAISMLSVFLPIYIYKELGYSLTQTLAFFILYATVFAIATPIAATCAARYGMKHTILVSVPFFLLFMVGLYFFPTLPLLAILLGCHTAFYWMGLHLVFYRSSHKNHRGEEVGTRQILTIIGASVGPIAGGAIIHFAGFWLLFLCCSIVLLFSALFLLLSEDPHSRYSFSLRPLLRADQWKNIFYFVSRGSNDAAAGIIWPIMVFIIAHDYFSLGLIGSISSGVSALLLYVVGKYSDRVDKRSIVHMAIGFESLSWFARSVASTFNHVLGITFFGAVTSGVVEAPLQALEYDKAKGEITAYFVQREICINLGRILLLAVVIVINTLPSGLILHGILNFAALLF